MIGKIKELILAIAVAKEITKKGGSVVLALLFASRVITGRTSYKDIPAKLKDKVKEILIAEGLEELCEE